MSEHGDTATPMHTEIPSELVSKRKTYIDPSYDLQALALIADNDDELTPTATPRAGSPPAASAELPAIKPPGLSTFTEFSDRPRQSSEATIKPVSERQGLRRRADTTPAGALQQMYSGGTSLFQPQLPRRAVSSKTARAFSRSGSRDRRRPSKDRSLTPEEPSQLGSTASRPLISKRKSNRSSVGRLGLKPKSLVWRMSSPPKSYELPPEIKLSLSEKARMKETLRLRNIETLKLTFSDTQSRALILPTPSTFYGRPLSIRTKTPPSLVGSFATLRGGAPSGNLTPLGSGTPPRSSTPLRTVTPVRSTTPRSARSSRAGTPSTRAKHFSSLSPVDQRIPWRTSIIVDSPQRDATPVPQERRRAYIPGPIQLEERISTTPRRGSVARERFDNGTVPRPKRFSNLIALDGIVMYFEALGVAEEASEACLDRFWLQTRRTPRQSTTNTSAKSSGKAALPVLPPSPPSPGGIATTFEGMFRSHKALRDDDDKPPPSPGTPGRRKPRLRQLLMASLKPG
ncbi:hypothetical protein BU23DRAFT_571901 [Bimuria novae-zelandiae CBS 107.79]|uniref:Uncharacterized protein n=1 Tax=Bimuria novae-zelandiae CBS 107.79 TaxID=1447943 RepID=A0A6A5V6P5_9PLEO|nr:hypothetical protein BU23DRAFT_571901 [Bimuria novae-zelandiae CBS 107.79]